jgi:hypothetical protein
LEDTGIWTENAIQKMRATGIMATGIIDAGIIGAGIIGAGIRTSPSWVPARPQNTRR